MAVTDHQQRKIDSAAAMLPLPWRLSFLRKVNDALAAVALPSDADVQRAIADALDRSALRLISRKGRVQRRYLTDAQANRTSRRREVS